jgi:hypothetical protein
VEFVDGYSNIIVPKAVRPMIDLKNTPLAAKRESTNNTAVAAFISEVMVRDTLYIWTEWIH